MKSRQKFPALVAAIIVLPLLWLSETWAQDSNDTNSPGDGGGGLIAAHPTRIKGDPAIAYSALTALPGEKPGDDRRGFIRYMALAYLGAHTELLNYKVVAKQVALLFLTDEARFRYLEEVVVAGIGHYAWKGSNEFHAERTFRAFADEFRPRFADAAPKLPIDFRIVQAFTLGRYDFERGGYHVAGPEIASKESGWLAHVLRTLPVAYYVNFENRIHVPKFMQMSTDRAEELTNFLADQNGGNRVYFSTHVRVLDIQTSPCQQKLLNAKTATAIGDYVLFIELKSLTLYADKDLSRVISRYHPEKADTKTMNPRRSFNVSC